jgi:hypothetical protein
MANAHDLPAPYAPFRRAGVPRAYILLVSTNTQHFFEILIPHPPLYREHPPVGVPTYLHKKLFFGINRFKRLGM